MTEFNAQMAREMSLREVPVRVESITSRVQQAALQGHRHVDIYKVDGHDLKPGEYQGQSPVTQAIVAKLRDLGFTTKFLKGVEGHAQNTVYYIRLEW